MFPHKCREGSLCLHLWWRGPAGSGSPPPGKALHGFCHAGYFLDDPDLFQVWLWVETALGAFMDDRNWGLSNFCGSCWTAQGCSVPFTTMSFCWPSRGLEVLFWAGSSSPVCRGHPTLSVFHWMPGRLSRSWSIACNAPAWKLDLDQQTEIKNEQSRGSLGLEVPDVGSGLSASSLMEGHTPSAGAGLQPGSPPGLPGGSRVCVCLCPALATVPVVALLELLRPGHSSL